MPQHVCFALQAKPPVGSFVALPPAIPGRSRLIAAELAPITSSPYQCLDLDCLCTYLRGELAVLSIYYAYMEVKKEFRDPSCVKKMHISK